MTAPPRQHPLIAFGPHAGAHRVAVRAAISILVPLLTLWALHHAAWSLYAAFGAFTSVYGRERVDLHRVRLQAVAGAALVVAVTLGAIVGVSAHRAWLAVPIAAVLSAVITYASGAQGWHPPGSLFCVFGFASVAAVPGTWADVGRAAAVSALAAVFAIVVGNLGAAVRRVRRTVPDSPAGPAIGGAAGRWGRQALTSGVGVLVAGAVATGAGIDRPYWAMVSAVVPLVAADPAHQVIRGVHRVVGTAVGLGVAWALLETRMPVVVTILLVAALQAGAELLVGRNYAVALVVITPLALLMVHMASPTPVDRLLADRGVETLIGVVIGLAVGFALRPGRMGPWVHRAPTGR